MPDSDVIGQQTYSFGEWAGVQGGAKTNVPVAAAPFGKRLYLFGVGTDGNIYSNSALEDQPFGQWNGVQGGGKTDVPVAAAPFGKRLYLFGVGTDGNIYSNSALEDQPFGQWAGVQGGGKTNVPVAAAPFGKRLYLFGVGTDGNIYSNSALEDQPFGQWNGVQGGGKTNVPLAAAPFGKRLYLFGVGTDGNIYSNSALEDQPFGQWNGVQGGMKTDAAVATAVFRGRIYLFAKGLNDRIYMNSASDGSPFVGWTEVPGNGKTDVALAATSFGDKLYLFGKGLDGEVYVNAMRFVGDKFCEFLDPVGSPTLGPQSYGLKSGHRRPSRLTVSPNVGDKNPSVISAFQKWVGATVPAPGAAPLLTIIDVGVTDSADVKVRFGNLPPNPDGSIPAGSTTADGTSITLATDLVDNFDHVITHEAGHALGLLHSTNPSSIMYPFDSNSSADLNAEDVAAIRALYGWLPQIPIPGIGTVASPALCACGNTLVMAWRGSVDDDNIYVARSSDGTNWSPQQQLPNNASADGPAMAWDGATLWLTHRGVPGDDSLYWATSSDFGEHWSALGNIPNVGSLLSPSITIFQGAPLVVWRGVDGDDSIYYTTWQPADQTWAPQKNVGGVGTADRPAVCVDFNGLPRMVWRGIPDDDALYTSTMVDLFWQPQQQVQWIIAGNGPAGTVGFGTAASVVGPSLACDGSAPLLLTWQGVAGDDSIYFTQAASGQGGQPPFEWSTQANVSGTGTSARPAIAIFKGKIILVWKGVQDDHNIYLTANER